MKPVLTLLLSLFISLCTFSQTKKKQDKAPTQKEMQDMMKEAQGMMDEMMKEMSPEDKRMMDSMGIKVPGTKNVKVPAMSDKQLADAWDDEMRIVPKKDAARIASIAKSVTDARMLTYIASIQKKMMDKMDAATLKKGNAIYAEIQKTAKSKVQAGNMATSFWLNGDPAVSLLLLGRVCSEDASNTDNLSNYASMLIMNGGQHLAIPILETLNAKFRRNTSILNNLGQAWFGLGEISKAEKYLDSVTAIYPYHPQANLTKSLIEENKGNKTKAIECLKKSIRHAYTREKEERLNKLGYKLTRKDVSIPFKPSADPLGLEKTRRPDYPTSIAQIDALHPQWKQFNSDIDKRIQQLQKEMQEVTTAYGKSAQAMAAKFMSSGGTLETPFMRKASLQLEERKAYYQQRFKKLNDLFLDLKTDLDAIKKSKKIAAPEAPCSVHRDAINDMLKAYNERKKLFDDEALKIFRHYCNDMVFWSQYTSIDDNAFQLIKLEFELTWLQKNREYQPAFMNEYAGAYKDCVEKENGKAGKLSDFDDIACQYKSSINLGIIKQEISCSRTTTTYDAKLISFTSREMGSEYVGGTLKYSPKVSIGGKAGPISVEAFAGTDYVYELDKDNSIVDWHAVTSVGVSAGVGGSAGPVKAEGSVSGSVEIEFGPKGVSDANFITRGEVSAGAMGQQVEIGVEDRVSLISGHGSVKGTGSLSGITMTQW
jgi:tetratricopeptide (TPR) repeat protein